MPEAFKNFISPQVVAALGELMLKAYPSFNYVRFVNRCLAKLETLELKDRAIHIGETLWQELPLPPAEAIDIVQQAIQPVPLLEADDSVDRWMLFPINALLSAHGLEAWDASMTLLPEVTKRYTAEFGIRRFLNENPRKMLPLLKRWAKDPDPNLRRLVSEGTRPRLPWGEQLTSFINDPSPVLPLLELLKDDPSAYVRRSVANNLNDISKDHPDTLLDVVTQWLPQADAPRRRLIKHACRSLVKQGHPRCLKLLGYRPPQLSIPHFAVSPQKINLGQPLKIALQLESLAKREQNLIVDYCFHLVKANGKTAGKVFKGHVLLLAALTKKSLTKTFHLKAISTRRYYTGENTIELLVNGQSLARGTFHLSVPR